MQKLRAEEVQGKTPKDGVNLRALQVPASSSHRTFRTSNAAEAALLPSPNGLLAPVLVVEHELGGKTRTNEVFTL